jgi:hypothetical protein
VLDFGSSSAPIQRITLRANSRLESFCCSLSALFNFDLSLLLAPLRKSPVMVGTMTQLDNFIFTCDCAILSVSPPLVEGSRAHLTSPLTSDQKIKVKRFFQYQPELNPIIGM